MWHPIFMLILMATAKDSIPTKDIWIGDINAPISIVVFIDYESVACADANKIINQLLDDHAGHIRVNFRHFPLAHKHQKAMKAAEAAVAAAQENLFLPVHQMLFDNRKNLGTISLKAYAKEAGSTNKKFLDQLVNGMYAWQVREDLLDGLQLGIRDVPGIIIQGKVYGGEVSTAALSKVIQSMM